MTQPPNYDDLYSRISKYTPNKHLNNPAAQSAIFGVDPFDQAEANDLGLGAMGGREIRNKQEAALALQFWTESETEFNKALYGEDYRYTGAAGLEISRRTGGAVDPNTGEYISIEPANFSGNSSNLEIPTQTSNPERPRTVAAAFDPVRNILTVVFRDGTFYNYYQVSKAEWASFRGAPSKGEFIADTLDSKPRGAADMDYVSPEVQELAARSFRVSQLRESSTKGWTRRKKRRYVYSKNVSGSKRNPFG